MGEPLEDNLTDHPPIPLAEQMRLAREALERTIAAIRQVPRVYRLSRRPHLREHCTSCTASYPTCLSHYNREGEYDIAGNGVK